jgi:hypothetical protein
MRVVMTELSPERIIRKVAGKFSLRSSANNSRADIAHMNGSSPWEASSRRGSISSLFRSKNVCQSIPLSVLEAQPTLDGTQGIVVQKGVYQSLSG